MKKISLLFLICFFCNVVPLTVHGVDFVDVVYLKNGSVVKGTIVETIPDISIKIQTRDGSVFVYKMSEIERYGKEEIKGKVGGESDADKLIKYGEMKSAGMWKWTCYLSSVGLAISGVPLIFVGLSNLGNEYTRGSAMFAAGLGIASVGGAVWLWRIGQNFAEKEKRLKLEYGTGSLFDIQKEGNRYSYNTGLPLIGIDSTTGKSTITLLTYRF